jgi:photosystem II stability/assembly factor-like uncharacterized protein
MEIKMTGALTKGRWRVARRLFFSFLCAFALLQAGAALARASWNKQPSGTMAWLHAVYFVDQSKGWAVGGNGALLITTDGGQSWKVTSRVTDDALRDVYFSDERNGWLVCERNIYQLKTNDEPRTYLMRTTDGGATWSRVNVIGRDVDARLVRALFTSEGRAWAFGEAGVLYRTDDDGENWSRQRPPTRYLLLGGMFLNAQQGWLVGASATILRTADGGATWRAGTVQTAKTVNLKDVRFNAVYFVEPRIGWAVGTGGRIFMTLDGGRTWNQQQSNVRADLYDVKFLNASEGWAVGAEGTILHTINSGLRWTVERSGTTHPLERLFFAGRERGWAVGFGGTIISYTRSAAPPKAPQLKQK